MNFNTIDKDGFLVGSIHPSVVSDLNRDRVVEDATPETALGFLERWRWVSGQWVADVDYRGHAWYNPVHTDQVHYPKSFDAAPPEGWVYWAPGQNKIVPPEESAANQWALVRSIRDRLLSESDWVVTKAVELGLPVGSDWSEYRQGLRDITAQSDPFLIQWPVKPGASVVHEDIQDEYLGQETLE
jgi:hypothetical protein